MNIDAQLEAILFVSGGPVTLRALGGLLNVLAADIEAALLKLEARLREGSGLTLVRHGQEVELVTHPDTAEIIRRVSKLEAQAELSKASLEALSILAYRGPLTRAELEQIRGVQSAIILRNLMLRGLVEMREEVRLGQPVFQVTMDFVKHLGLSRLEELPDFTSLHTHPTVEQVLDQLEPKKAPPVV